MGQPKFTRQMKDADFEALFPNDDACKTYLTHRRWPDGVVKCPRCGNDKVWALKARPFHWLCRNCSDSGYRFSVTVGTIFENSNVGLRQWFKVIYLMLTSKKGIAALQVHRMMGFGSYETAHFMCMRVRAGLADPKFRQLIGIVEVDETYVGGKNKNRHRDKLASDEHGSYCGLSDHPDAFVRHGHGEYVVGAVHTCTIDGFWSLLKRGIMGTFHKVSAEYLPLYVAELTFRYNNRQNHDIFGAAVARS